MSSSIIPQPVGAMRPQTAACCFCCLSAFNGLSFMDACLSVCVLHICGYPSITSLHFELQDVKEGKGDLRQWATEGVVKRGGQQGEKKDKRQRRKGGRETGRFKKCLSTSTLLSPARARGPRPRSSPEFHSCQGTKQHWRVDPNPGAHTHTVNRYMHSHTNSRDLHT